MCDIYIVVHILGSVYGLYYNTPDVNQYNIDPCDKHFAIFQSRLWGSNSIVPHKNQ